MAEFPYNPDWSYEIEPDYDVEISTFENQVEQRRLISSGSLRKWRFVFGSRTQAELDIVIAFFNARKGALESFTWTDPADGVEYTGRFDKGSFKYVPVSHGIYNYEFIFVEVK